MLPTPYPSPPPSPRCERQEHACALLLFGGSGATVEKHGEYLTRLAEAMALSLGATDAIVFYPPRKKNGCGGSWAEYEPTALEVAAKGWPAAWQSTRHAALGDVNVACESALFEAAERVEKLERLWLVGVSNGAIAAVHLATLFGPHVNGVALLSGLPAVEQMDHLIPNLRTGVCLTLGSQEEYFGGRDSFISVAAALDARVIEYEGKHARETPSAVQRVCQVLLQHSAR